MASELWMRDDIKNVLLALELSSAHLAAHMDSAEIDAYRRGFQAAIAAAAVSFGIPVRSLGLPSSPSERALDSGKNSGI